MEILFKELKRHGWIIESKILPYSGYRFLNLKDGDKLSFKAENSVQLHFILSTSPPGIFDLILQDTTIQAEFVQNFRDIEHMSFREIGEVMGFSKQRAQQLYKLRLDAKYHSKWSILVPTWEKLYQNGMGICKIAKESGVSSSVVHRALKKIGVDTAKKKGIEKKKENITNGSDQD